MTNYAPHEIKAFSGAELLAIHNQLARELGKSELKGVKLSKVGFIMKINALKALAEAAKPKAAAKLVKRADKRVSKPEPDATSVADFARTLDINPKVARAALRRKGMAGPYTLTSAVRDIIQAMAA